MCGIAGIIGRSADLNAIFTMTTVQAHRGPDDHGHLFIGSDAADFVRDQSDGVPERNHFAALGHLRLSILDCSEGARQPMHLTDGKDWISYNGEIYNYVELRAELQELGYSFHTTGDTEVLLAAYRAWGTDCFNRFNGMWAVIIWDEKNQRFVLSRDRFGIKPLHYATWNGALYLTSEIKGITKATDVPRTANRAAIFEYLKFSTVNHNNGTFFAHIHAFPPGHFAIIDPEAPEQITPQRFWDFTASKTADITQAEADIEFTRLLNSAVDIRMRSDVPVGSCLSGGLDSSAIVGLAAKGQAENFHTFTSCFEDKRFDERKWAELVNAQMQTRAHYVTPDQKSFIADLDKLIWHQEEPFTTASIFAQWCIMREARQSGIPVLLDGQGADEVLCGYRKFTVYYLRDLLREKRLGKLVSELFALMRRGDRGLLNLHDAQRYLPTWLRKAAGKDSRHYLNAAAQEEYAATQSRIAGKSSVGERQKLDIKHFSVPSLLRYEDRNSMAFSIESRVPFLDYRLVDWAIGLPTGIKITNGQSKAILRRSMRGTVPDAVLDRRDKMGFVTPQRVWMQEQFGKVMHARFTKPDLRIGALVNIEALKADVSTYRADDKTVSDGVLFRFFMLEAWMETFDVTL